MKDEEKKDGSILLLLILARAAATDRHTVGSIAAHPHRLIVVLRRFGVVRWRHIRPSGSIVHHLGPLLRHLDPVGARVGQGAPLPWQQRSLQCPYRSLSAPVVRQRRLHFPSVAVVVVSEDKKKKDVFSFSFSSSSSSLYILILTKARRLFVLPRPHGLIVVFILDQTP